MVTGHNYKGCKMVKRDGKIITFANNGEGWVTILNGYSVYSIDDAEMLVDHHLQK